MTDTQYLAWLNSTSAIRCVLVEADALVAGVETVRYLSSANYVTSGADTPAHTAYLAVIDGGVTITEKLSIDGSATLSFGDIEIGNENGDLDSWLNDVWANRTVRLFVGDVRWPREDFRQIFSGTLAGISSRARNTLNLSLRDKLQRLNTPLSDAKLGGATQNKDRTLPMCFGECHNVEPLLIDPALLKYQVHDGAIERIIEVRDNGAPVNFTDDLAAGTFTLSAQPAGVITVSVQGDKYGGVYRHTVGSLVGRIVTGYGKSGDRFVAGDLDADNLAEFEADHPQVVGLYLASRTNVLQACADLAASVGAQPAMSAAGQLRLLKISLSALGEPTEVTSAQMDAKSLHIADRTTVQAAVKVGYCKNWTVQTSLQTGIPEQHKNLFAQEWLTRTEQDAAVASAWRLAVEPVQIDTLLLTEADASAEASRRLSLWAAQRTVYGYTGTPALMLESLGESQTLTHARYGMSGGVTGQIVGLTRDWLTCRTQIEVMA